MLFEPRTAFVVGLSVVVGLSIPIQAQNSSQEQEQPTTAEASAPVILLEFSASKVPDGDAITAFLDMAADPRVSRLEVSGLFGSIGTVDGTLVFQSPDAFSRWRENGMEPFFQPVGGMSAVDATLRGFRPALLAKSHPQGSGEAFKRVSISYQNSGNDSAGDADIDAVTVICPGDHADCKPSN